MVNLSLEGSMKESCVRLDRRGRQPNPMKSISGGTKAQALASFFFFFKKYPRLFYCVPSRERILDLEEQI